MTLAGRAGFPLGWNTRDITDQPPSPGREAIPDPSLTDENDPSARRRTPARTLAIRLGLSIAMLAVLVWRLPDVRWHDLGPRWSSTSWIWLVGAAVTMASAFGLSALRWQRVLAAMTQPPPYRRMLSHFIAGQFVSNVLPTAFGGDVIRVARLGRDLDDNPTSFASVTIERMTGWLVLPLISGAAFAIQPDLLDLGSATALAVSIGIGTVVALVIVLAVASNRRFGANFDTVTGWRRFLVAIHLGIDALRRAPRAAAEVILIGVAFQALQCLAVWMAAEAIGLTAVTLGVVAAFFPAAAIAQNLPVGLGGLGVREGIFVIFFGAVGAPRALAITLGLVVYALTLLTSAFGAPSFVFGAKTPSLNPHTQDVASSGSGS